MTLVLMGATLSAEEDDAGDDDEEVEAAEDAAAEAAGLAWILGSFFPTAPGRREAEAFLTGTVLVRAMVSACCHSKSCNLNKREFIK